MKKVYFLNDCSRCHVGSVYVTMAFQKALERYEVYGITTPPAPKNYINLEKLEKCDALVVNGEGVIHHTENYRNGNIELLQQMSVAKKMGKKVLLMNCVFECIEPKYKGVLNSIDYISVREPFSKQHLMDIGVTTEIDVCLDATAYHEYKDIEQIRDKKIAVGSTHHEFNGVKEFEKLRSVYDNLPMPKRYFIPYLRELSRYECLITGQHHGVYACLFSKTPFIAFPSNTYKIESFLSWCDCGIEIEYDVRNMPQRLEGIKKESYDYLFNEWFIQQRKALMHVMDEKMHQVIND